MAWAASISRSRKPMVPIASGLIRVVVQVESEVWESEPEVLICNCGGCASVKGC